MSLNGEWSEGRARSSVAARGRRLAFGAGGRTNGLSEGDGGGGTEKAGFCAVDGFSSVGGSESATAKAVTESGASSSCSESETLGTRGGSGMAKEVTETGASSSVSDPPASAGSESVVVTETGPSPSRSACAALTAGGMMLGGS